MGLLDRYRRYDDRPPEARRELVERRRQERRRSLERRGPLDLSQTVLPTLPNPEVVNAAIAVARTRLQDYPDPEGSALRRALGSRHGVDPAQITTGNGAGELLRHAAQALLGPGDELLAPEPSYPLYPVLARLAGAELVQVPLEDGGRPDPEALLERVTGRTRAVVLCNPNDPTGGYLESDRVASLLERLPERAWLLLDEALVDFQTVEPRDASLRLVERFPRLLVFRTFSKAWGLPGLRAGYVVGSERAQDLLHAAAPVLGPNAVSQAAVAYAVEHGEQDVERRRSAVIAERGRLLERLRELPVEAAPSEANFVWLRAPGLSGSELAARLGRLGVLVAHDERAGDPDHVRVAVRDPAATGRLVDALAEAATGRTGSRNGAAAGAPPEAGAGGGDPARNGARGAQESSPLEGK